MIKYWGSTLSTFSSVHHLLWFQAGPSQRVRERLWTETLTTVLTPFPPVVAAEKQIKAQKQLCSCNTLWHLQGILFIWEPEMNTLLDFSSSSFGVMPGSSLFEYLDSFWWSSQQIESHICEVWVWLLIHAQPIHPWHSLVSCKLEMREWWKCKEKLHLIISVFWLRGLRFGPDFKTLDYVLRTFWHLKKKNLC